MFVDFKLTCFTKSVTNKFNLCNIINNDSITIHNAPITESVVSAYFIALDALSDSDAFIEQISYESCAWEWLTIAEL